eukprot:gnl/TRDRNA2_/TRDRNA2_80543_c0_seq1.p1 gnl/TRDRNA2_/TRDRNA2_80543_c0~~gnl/TRDRNA2_/TRDRNA2_80543_c0_seq1.p1  ORF type:complete len:151 (-),score=25.69 gnl/TRDRNA2_/TRDRNA2_80543_c0_seq1:366-773(-)
MATEGRHAVPSGDGRVSGGEPERAVTASTVIIEVGAPGALSWLPRDGLKDGDLRRLLRISQELERRGFHVLVRHLDTPPPFVVFRRGTEERSEILYVADHIREFYGDGSGPHYELALQAVETGVPQRTYRYTDES